MTDSWWASWSGPAPRLSLHGGAALPSLSHARDGARGVLFDGLLYNAAELAERLADSSGPTNSPADLMLRAFRRWGSEAPRRARGVFALLFWDEERDLLMAARDPLGTYPLFFARAGEEVLLSTSIDALVRHPRTPKGLNRGAVAAHLGHHWPPEEETLHRSVRRVLPGYCLRIERGRQSAGCYWDLTERGMTGDWVDEGELEGFDNLLAAAVGRCQALGPSAIFLSGGLDSVSVGAVAADRARREGLPEPLALSLAFPAAECDEEEVQRRVAEVLEIPQVVMPFHEAAGPEGLLSKAVERCGEWPSPLLNPWWPLYVRLAEAAVDRGCRVIMTGSGGDEWLTVDYGHLADLVRSFNLMGAARLAGTIMRSYRLPRHHLLRFMVWRAGVRPVLALHARRLGLRVAPDLVRRRWRRHYQRSLPAWLAPEREIRSDLEERIERTVKQRTATPDPSGPFGFYWQSAPGSIVHPLVSMDREEDFETSRRLGASILHPYWDAELVEFLCRIPPELLHRGGREKGLVRQAAARRFPDLGFERQRKILATDFFSSLLRAEGAAVWKRMGGLPTLVQLGIVDGSSQDAILSECLATSSPAIRHRIWELLGMEAWARQYA